jgi:3-oxoacyl-[acyl-carrier-protein] synthase II
LTLENRDAAIDRGARILAEIVGYGLSNDCHHLTQPHPQGDAALATMQQACQMAGIEPRQIDYINAHGTGTALNDSSEAAAINRWAGKDVSSIPVSSTKGSIGHLLGAAGAIEAAICVMVLNEGWLPPSPSTENPDPACHFPIVQHAQERRCEYVLSNSFGFGGANATLVLRRGQE